MVRKLRELRDHLRAKLRNAEKKRHDAHAGPRRRKLAEVVQRIRDHLEQIVARIKSLGRTRVNTSLGAPHWGGSADVMHALVYPIADQYGMPWEGDDKEYGHAVGGDHDPNVLNAFAEDFPTFDGAAFANAVARKLGKSSGSVGTYDFIYFTYQGHRWRGQVLWAVEGHYNHVHVGIRAV